MKIQNLCYPRTNEELNAISLGLNPTKDDVILAIGGSGDQAFALLENAKSLVCIDSDKHQVEFIRERAELLRRGYYEEFLSIGDVIPDEYDEKQRDDYFKKGERLKRIRSNLENMTIVCEPLQDAAKLKCFTQMYLSNGLDYLTRPINLNEVKQALTSLSDNLSSGGRIYLTNHERLCRQSKKKTQIINKNLRREITIPEDMLPECLELDEERTTLARMHERILWHPAIYRKVAP